MEMNELKEMVDAADKNIREKGNNFLKMARYIDDCDRKGIIDKKHADSVIKELDNAFSEVIWKECEIIVKKIVYNSVDNYNTEINKLKRRRNGDE